MKFQTQAHQLLFYSGLQRTLSTVPSSTPLTLDAAADDAVAAAQGHAPSAEMKKAASEIARQCLRQWDGFLGIHAGTDSAGAKAGVWRGKFDGVRCAVLLLAFRKMNKGLQNRSNESSRFGTAQMIQVGLAHCVPSLSWKILITPDCCWPLDISCNLPLIKLFISSISSSKVKLCIGYCWL